MDTTKDTYGLSNYIQTEVPNEQLSPLEIPLVRLLNTIKYYVVQHSNLFLYFH